MVELSYFSFSATIELIAALLIVLGWLFYKNWKQKKRDRQAADQLLERIRHQSEVRLHRNTKFFKEKYMLDAADLEQALRLIDHVEQRFIQKIINVYLNRDSKGLVKMDAFVAELVTTYQSLSPEIPTTDLLRKLKKNPAIFEEIEVLRQLNQDLKEEITITKQTMNEMLNEFSNMFGGGADNSLDAQEIMDELQTKHSERNADTDQLPEDELDLLEKLAEETTEPPEQDNPLLPDSTR